MKNQYLVVLRTYSEEAVRNFIESFEYIQCFETLYVVRTSVSKEEFTSIIGNLNKGTSVFVTDYVFTKDNTYGWMSKESWDKLKEWNPDPNEDKIEEKIFHFSHKPTSKELTLIELDGFRNLLVEEITESTWDGWCQEWDTNITGYKVTGTRVIK